MSHDLILDDYNAATNNDLAPEKIEEILNVPEPGGVQNLTRLRNEVKALLTK